MECSSERPDASSASRALSRVAVSLWLGVTIGTSFLTSSPMTSLWKFFSLRCHPVYVALKRVYLAVVNDEAVRMRQFPGAERVRGEPGVDQRERRDHTLIGQVVVEALELVGHDEALVNQRARGEAADVEVAARGQVVAKYGFLGLLAYGEQSQFELELALDSLGPPDGELPDERHDARRQRAYLVGRHRHVAPSEETLSLFLDDPFYDGFTLLPLARLRRQEYHADAVASGFRDGYSLRSELARNELVGHLHDYAGAVPGFGVRARGSTVSEVYQDFQALFDDAMRLSPLDVGDKSDPARFVFESGVVQSVGRETRRVVLVIAVSHSYALNRFVA